MKMWLNIYASASDKTPVVAGGIYLFRKQADSIATSGRFACVEVEVPDEIMAEAVTLRQERVEAEIWDHVTGNGGRKS